MRKIYLGLIFGVVVSQSTWGLPEFWLNFWGKENMNFIKNDESGPNLQRLKLEKNLKEEEWIFMDLGWGC